MGKEVFAVDGVGVMGAGWIAQIAGTSREAICYDVSSSALDTLKERVKDLLGKMARKLKIEDKNFVDNALSLITICRSEEEFIELAKERADFFLEVIFEDMKLKCEVLSRILPKLPSHVIFMSNTSSLDINEMAEAGGRPDRSIVTHGMNPVPLVPAVEIVVGKKTSKETLERVQDLLKDMGKKPFLAPNIPGFLVNNLFIPFALSAVRLLELGLITVEDADIGLTYSLGHPQGIFKLLDYITIPTLLRVSQQMFAATCDPRMEPPAILHKMTEAGEWGRFCESKLGFYDWRGEKPIPRDLTKYCLRG
jgi:3-hydroxybutyryl-CoA dehydrogenase